LNQLLIALRFYATGSFQIVVSDLFKVDKSTVCRCLQRVTSAIAELRDKYVKFPDNSQKRKSMMQQFHCLSQLPGIVGSIDCTHVLIQSPGGDDTEIYRNRKGYISVNVQLVCDPENQILDVVARWPGSVHDSTVFDNSHLRAVLETGEVEGHLIGDSGYACRPYMLTPVLKETSEAERRYNAAHASARNCIERTNGLLKRFPCLKYGMRLRIDNTLAVVVATVILHKIAVLTREYEPEDDEELDNFISRRRQRGVQVDYDAVEVLPLTGLVAVGSRGVRQSIINNIIP